MKYKYKQLNPKYWMYLILALVFIIGSFGSVKDGWTIPSGIEPEHPEIQAVIDKHLPNVLSEDLKEREGALWGLHNELQTLWNTKRISANQYTRKQISKPLITLYENTLEKDFWGPHGRGMILDILVMNGDNEIAKPFVFKIIEEGNNEEKLSLIRNIGFPRGITGDDVYEKVQELQTKKIIERKLELSLLARINREKALPEVVHELTTSSDPDLVYSAARILQNTYQNPKHYRVILPRIKAVGLDKKIGNQNHRLHFIDRDLLLRYVDGATKEDARVALEIFNKTPFSSDAIPVLKRKLNDSNSDVRGLAAKGLRKAIESNPDQADGIIKTLQSSVAKEKNPTTKNHITTVIHEIQALQDSYQRREHRKN